MPLQTEDIYDTLTLPTDQNRELRRHLNGVWISRKVHKIERIERVSPAENRTGWRLTYEPA